METTEIRKEATTDLTQCARNALGHWTDCPYWDWVDFSKCDCAKGLADVPEQAEAYQVAPMPLRDYFAATASVPWEEAVNLAAAEQANRVSLGGQVTLAEVVEARVRLRYLEADAMIVRRTIKPRAQFEAGKERGEKYGESLAPESEQGTKDKISGEFPESPTG
jgi:hypothetical protein